MRGPSISALQGGGTGDPLHCSIPGLTLDAGIGVVAGLCWSHLFYM